MPILKFKATPGFKFYHDRPSDWRDGEEHEVTESKAQYLTVSFPNNFSLVEMQKAVDPKTTENKMVKEAKNKGR